MRSLPVIPALLLGAALAGAGCYTVLRHPETYDLTDEYGEEKVCADCHAEADLYHYTDGRWGGWYELYPAPWAVYYQTPWWYGDYWYAPYPPPPAGEPIPAETGRRHMWDRQIEGARGSIPPQQVREPSEPQKPENSPSRTDDKPQEDRDGEKEKDKDSGKRRLWGR